MYLMSCIYLFFMKSKRSKSNSLLSQHHHQNEIDEDFEQMFAAKGNPAVPVQYQAEYTGGATNAGTMAAAQNNSAVGQARHMPAALSSDASNSLLGTTLQRKTDQGSSSPQNVTQFQYNVATSYPAVPLQMKSERILMSVEHRQAQCPKTTNSDTAPKEKMAVERPLDYLIFSSNSYADNPQLDLPEGWQLLRNVSDKSGYQGVVYINTCREEIVIAHRGTDEMRKDLLQTDLLMYLIETGQEKVANEITTQIKDAYGEKYKIMHTGHSLGGFLAGEMAARFSHHQAVTFDSPGIESNRDAKQNSKRQANYQSAPNIVNSAPAIGDFALKTLNAVNPFGSMGLTIPPLTPMPVPNTTKINPNGKASIKSSHDIYDYMREYFDPKTGQPYIELFPEGSKLHEGVFERIRAIVQLNQDLKAARARVNQVKMEQERLEKLKHFARENTAPNGAGASTQNTFDDPLSDKKRDDKLKENLFTEESKYEELVVRLAAQRASLRKYIEHNS